jgi:hypothetical protein
LFLNFAWRELSSPLSLMTLATIKERLNQKPFWRFALETTGGTWIDVNREADCAIFERNDAAR